MLWCGGAADSACVVSLSGRGGADCHDEAQRTDGARRGHAGVPGGHNRLLSSQRAHRCPVPAGGGPERAARREGTTNTTRLNTAIRSQLLIAGALTGSDPVGTPCHLQCVCLCAAESSEAGGEGEECSGGREEQSRGVSQLGERRL